MPYMSLQLLLLFILIILSAFFSGSETALMAVNQLRLRHLTRTGIKNAQRLSEMLEHRNKILTAILVGNNVVNIAASSLATGIAIMLLGAKGISVAVLVMTVTILVFGEIFPKTLAASKAERISLAIVPAMAFLNTLLAPVVKVLTLITNIMLKRFGGHKSGGTFVTEEEIRTMVTVGQEEGVLEKEEGDMIDSIFEFTDTLAREVMLPRPDMTTISADITYHELVAIIIKTQYSRLPVIRDSVDNVVGILYVKDLFVLEEGQKENFDVTQMMRQAYFIPETKNVRELFNEFRHRQLHIAIVIDEYGGTAGLVTLEDLIEEITGEIFDEYDVEEKLIEKVAPNLYKVDAATPVEDINDMFNLDLPSVDYFTIGGLVLEQLGRIPQEGEVCQLGEIELKVAKVTGRRLENLLIKTKRGD